MTRKDSQINGDRPVVIDFWATWCGPCKLIGPIFEKLSGQFPGADYYKVDIDAAPEIAQEVGVRAVRRLSVKLVQWLMYGFRCPLSWLSRAARSSARLSAPTLVHFRYEDPHLVLQNRMRVN